MAADTTIAAAIDELLSPGRDDPVLVAIDGRGGIGKSTIAAAVAARLAADTTLIDGDDFCVGPPPGGWTTVEPSRRADRCVDWRRQRPVLEALATSTATRWQPYDWDRDDGTLRADWEQRSATPVVILEGTFSARPELADLFSLRILLEAEAEEQQRRFIAREGRREWDVWSELWVAAEDHYFHQVMPPDRFDLVVAVQPSG
ncbi:MAG: uridine kinase family protein [Acidimicrobiales bacterium]